MIRRGVYNSYHLGVFMAGETIGDRVRRLRELKGWSQRKLGAVAGTSGAYVNQLETGLRPKPGAEMLGKLARALGVTSEELLGEGNDIDDRSGGRPPEDPELEGVQVNLKTIKELDPESFKAVERVVQSMLREAEELHRERQRRAKSKRTDPEPPGQAN